MVIKRIAPLSLAKILLALYGIIGLIIGLCVALLGLMGVGFSDAGSAGGFIGMALGIGAIIILPLFYGALGFLVGMISAAVYNVAAGLVGGVQIEVQ
jgi:hypothetical protein